MLIAMPARASVRRASAGKSSAIRGGPPGTAGSNAGHGVCGTAVAEKADQNVPDVRAIDNYIACNTWTRSELVVLIRRGDLILGQIDIDSDVPDPFTPDEEAEVKQVADALAVLL